MDRGDVNLRSRILQESIEHQTRKARAWHPIWTKKPRYDGQATFNSKDGMRQVPFAKSQTADQPIWTTRSPLQEDVGQAQPWSGSSSGSDPIMHELNEMQRQASPDSDAQVEGEGNRSAQERTQGQEKQRMPPKRHLIDDFDSTRQKKWTLPQREARPITQVQLVSEVKAIYAGLVMVEKKCVEIVQQQKTLNQLFNEQFQALFALHRTLLYEHHDFFLATQHPSASPALRRLATKYAMPSRMWQHGIHSFLELLRHRLPNNFDHMLAFLYLARSMVTIVEKILPEADEQWADCRRCLELYSEILARAPFATPDVSDDSSRDHSSGGWTAQSSPSSQSSIPTLCSSSLSEFHRYNISDGTAGQEEEFGDWYFQHYPPPEPLSAAETEQSYNKLPFQLTDAVLCALGGWLEYGQVIATDFNIYCKVFHILLLSGMR